MCCCTSTTSMIYSVYIYIPAVYKYTRSERFLMWRQDTHAVSFTQGTHNFILLHGTAATRWCTAASCIQGAGGGSKTFSLLIISDTAAVQYFSVVVKIRVLVIIPVKKTHTPPYKYEVIQPTHTQQYIMSSWEYSIHVLYAVYRYRYGRRCACSWFTVQRYSSIYRSTLRLLWAPYLTWMIESWRIYALSVARRLLVR